MADTEFYDEMRETVWYLRVKFDTIDKEGKSKTLSQHGAGFTLRSDGLIMSVAHIIPEDHTYQVTARKMTESGFRSNITELYRNRAYDIAVFKIEGGEEFRCAKLARDGSVFFGEELIHVGHPDWLFWSLVHGKASYPCMEGDVHLPKGNIHCDNYSNPFENTRTYRRAGDFWDQNTLSSDSDSSSDSGIKYVKGLHAHLPLVQFTCPNAAGSSGGPVYNAQKEIIGMFALDDGGQAFAVHVSMLKSAFSVVETKNPRVEGSSSKGQSESPGH